MIKIFEVFNEKKNLRIERKIKIPKYLSGLLKFEFYRLGFFKQYDDKKINSIYFDDKHSTYFRSNLDGDLLRIKPRVRWYGDKLLFANHEFKLKKGFVGAKILNKEILKDIIEIEKIINICEEYHKKILNASLYATTTVKYKRSYLIHPSKIRLTIDNKILSKSQNSLNFIDMPFEVIEFKYEPYLDSFFRKKIFPRLNRISLRMTKCSKYSESMMV